ncbi:citrate transporter [Chromobacterium phragmitis]|uniref:Citrate transporter n=1 Tax=Chromobacterium phragmitis TaxID=2202141 RepID=A0A344UCT2_9NEIS|nr:citrate:proton symporter [Chromobacterium phragmitis]AXE31748.1 citrate transporter [Chromobacterium phragmitis]AXE33080.1 citrate transporter [Chromobacterium phragmitis]
MLTFAGLAIIVTVVSLLILRKLAPVVCLTLVPFLGALLAGFGFADIGKFYGSGLSSVVQVATMFIFAITFFGVMQDTGVFRPIVNGMVRVSGGNAVTVAVCTAVVGMLAHLDGVGATTFLLTVPTLLPLYRRLGMNPYLMMLLLALGAGILNMMPWAGPLGRAAAVTDLDPAKLWQPLIPLQLIGAALLVALAFGLGMLEARRLRGQAAVAPETADEDDGAGLPKRFFVNAALFLAVIGTLVSGILPSGYVFMIGLGVALVINYPDVDDQLARIREHAPNALLMGAIILGAGTFLGVLNGSGMLKAIAGDLVHVLPEGAAPHLHLILGVFGLPLDLVLSTDAYYFALLPVILEIVSGYGVEAPAAIYALMIGNVIGTFVSPFSPALWLGLGLAGLDMGRHIRHSLLTMWLFSLALMGVGFGLGLMAPA